MPANLEIRFPLKGINRNWSNDSQPPLTSPDLLNVRAQDVSENRTRGGQRPGLALLYAERIGSVPNPIVSLFQVTTTSE